MFRIANQMEACFQWFSQLSEMICEYFDDKMPESPVGICMNEKKNSGNWYGKEFEL